MPRIPTGRTVVVLAAILTLGLAGCGDDDPSVELVRGVPDAGFPLRGDLANDDAALADAAEEWVEEDEESGSDGVLDDDATLRITALWAGHVNDEDFVVLASEGHAAVVGRRDEREPRWSLRTTVSIRDQEDPGVVAFSNGILLPEPSRSSHLAATVSDIGVTTTDGLLHARGRYASELPSGVLYLPDGLPRRRDRPDDAPPVVVRTGGSGFSALRSVGPGLRSRLQPGTDAFDPPAMQRFVAATFDPPRPAEGRASRFAEPPMVDLVSDAPIAGVGPAMLIRTATSSWTRRPRVALGLGGSTVANGEEATALPLGGDGIDSDGYRASTGPALGLGIVVRATRQQEQTGEGPAPLLLVAGDDDVASIEVLAGSRRWTGRGPILTVPISWNRKRTTDTDFAVLGRDRRGRLVMPAGSGGDPTTVRLAP